MHIGILMPGHLPEPVRDLVGDYDTLYPNMLDGHDLEFSVWSIIDGSFPPNARAADGWLVGGSAFGVYDDQPWIPPLRELIREIYAARRPLVGICFGHQIMADSLGGKAEKYDGGWTIGPTDYRIETRGWRLGAWHQDQVTEVPPDATVVGESATCAYAALRYGDHAYSLQPHPEFDADALDSLLTHRAPGRVPEDRIARAKEALPLPMGTKAMGDRIAAFLKGHPYD